MTLTTICPNLRRLDVSFTGIRKPSLWVDQAPHLEKLCLTSTAISSGELCSTIRNLSKLKTLAIGALGVGTSPSTTINNTSSMTLNDNDLILVSDLLAEHGGLESLSLVSNTKLSLTRRESSALCHMISHVGRKCKVRLCLSFPPPNADVIFVAVSQPVKHIISALFRPGRFNAYV